MKASVEALVNQKGGGGKSSTTSLKVKVGLSQGLRVLALDLDPQAGLSEIFHAPGPGMADLLSGSELDEVLTTIETPLGQFDLVAADHELDRMYLSVDALSLKRALSSALDNYDLILLDCPPTMQGVTQSAVLFADASYVPCVVSKTALHATEYTLQCIKKLEKKPHVIFIGMDEALNAGGSRAKVAREFEERLGEFAVAKLPRSTTAEVMASDKSKRWTKPSTAAIMTPLARLPK
jgi:cellulose biosynthesis protein BcsQ